METLWYDGDCREWRIYWLTRYESVTFGWGCTLMGWRGCALHLVAVQICSMRLCSYVREAVGLSLCWWVSLDPESWWGGYLLKRLLAKVLLDACQWSLVCGSVLSALGELWPSSQNGDKCCHFTETSSALEIRPDPNLCVNKETAW